MEELLKRIEDMKKELAICEDEMQCAPTTQWEWGYICGLVEMITTVIKLIKEIKH